MTSLVLFDEVEAHLNTGLSVDVPADATAIAALRELIVDESWNLQRLAHRRFDHRVETRYYDLISRNQNGPINGPELILDDDLLSVTAIDNAGTAITTGYTLMPRSPDPNLDNNSPKNRIRLDAVGSQVWGAAVSIDPIAAITITGVWGYGGVWTDMSQDGSLVSKTETTLDWTGHGQQQEATLRMGTEYMRITDASAADKVEVQRGVNGSTAAIHDTVAIFRFDPEEFTRSQVRRLVAWRLEQENSPLFGVITVLDTQVPVNITSVPDDVQAALKKANMMKRVTKRLYAS